MPRFRTCSEGVLCRQNSKLDAFLKRNTDRSVYERIRAYEPCVVVSEKIKKAFMHVILSDDCIYLCEFPPRTLQKALCFSDVIDIDLVNDLPDFLSGRDREYSQHIRVQHTAAKHARKVDLGFRGKSSMPRSHASPFQRKSRSVSPHDGLTGILLSEHTAPPESVTSIPPLSDQLVKRKLHQGRSASCPTPELQGLPSPSPPSCDPDSTGGWSHQGRGRAASTMDSAGRALILAKLKGMQAEVHGGTRAELHLYVVSPASRLYLHLQSSWNSYIIRSTLLLDPKFRKRCSISSTSPPQSQHQASWERTAHLFGQLSREILQQDVTLEMLYLLLQELHTAAHRNTAVRRLFWRSGDLCPFLVKTLEDTLKSCWKDVKGNSKIHRVDQLLLSILLAQTLGLMFRETEIEPARLSLLTAERGALMERLLLALVCDPGTGVHCPAEGLVELDQDVQQTKLQALQAEYLDAASVLLFEVLVLAQQSCHTSTYERFLTVGWVLKTLQSHQYVLPFISHLAQQVVLVLSRPVLSPAEAVLLYQRCVVILACLHYSVDLGCHIRTEFREEFRYYIKMSWVEDILPPHYPISQPMTSLLSQLQQLVLQWP